MPGLLMIDEPPERVEGWRAELERAGYRITVVVPDGRSEAPVRLPVTPPDAIVLAAPSGECRAWDLLAALRAAGPDLRAVPVVLVVGPRALEDGLRGAIEGAVRCHAEPLAAETLVASLDAALAPDAPPVAEQRRRARQRALEILARIEARGAGSDDDAQPRLVHLTRLEHRRVPDAEPEPLADARRRIATLTSKQRTLLEVVQTEGGVGAAAERLHTSRGNVSAGLRRIVHRLGMRDTRELLRTLGDGRLLRTSRP